MGPCAQGRLGRGRIRVNGGRKAWTAGFSFSMPRGQKGGAAMSRTLRFVLLRCLAPQSTVDCFKWNATLCVAEGTAFQVDRTVIGETLARASCVPGYVASYV